MNTGFDFKYKGVVYNTADPSFAKMMETDPELGKEFKRRTINAINGLDAKSKKSFMSALTKGLNELCDQLIDIIMVEKGLKDKASDSVKGWTMDGNLLTKFRNDRVDRDITANVCFCTKSAREYINSRLGFEVKTVPYTYSDMGGYKGLAVVIE